MPAVYTVAEVAQIIDVWDGAITIPADIVPFISTPRDAAASPS